MRMKLVLLLVVSWISQTAARADCSLPCGVKEVLHCAAKAKKLSPKTFFNKVLFDQKSTVDSYCKHGKFGSNDQSLAKMHCKRPFYTYEGFVQASLRKEFSQLACKGTRLDRVRELAAFFANIAQETTSGLNYRNDALFFRWEVAGVGSKAYDAHPNLMTIDPPVKGKLQGFDFCYNGGYYKLERMPGTGMIRYVQDWKASCQKKQVLTDVLGQGSWFGRGPMQLTGDSILFYAAYLKNPNLVQVADQLLGNDLIGWTSAFWFWMNPKPNVAQAESPHEVLHKLGFGGATYKINGGCNQFEFRLKYYKFFMEELGHPIGEKEAGENLSCTT